MWKCTSLPLLKETNKQRSGGLTFSQKQFSTSSGHARGKASPGPLSSVTALPALPGVNSTYDADHGHSRSGPSHKSQKIYRGNSKQISQGGSKFSSGGSSTSYQSVKLPSLVPQTSKDKAKPPEIDVLGLSGSQNLVMSGDLEPLGSKNSFDGMDTKSSVRTISPEDSPRELEGSNSRSDKNAFLDEKRKGDPPDKQAKSTDSRKNKNFERDGDNQDVWLRRVMPFVHRFVAFSPKWREWADSLPLEEPLPASSAVDSALLQAETLLHKRLADVPLNASDATAQHIADAALEEGQAIIRSQWDAAEKRMAKMHAEKLQLWRMKAARHRANSVTVDAAFPVTCLEGGASVQPPSWKPSFPIQEAITVDGASNVTRLDGAASLKPYGWEEAGLRDDSMSQSTLHAALVEAQDKLKLAQAQLEDAQRAHASAQLRLDSAESRLKQRDESLDGAEQSKAEGWQLARTLATCGEQNDTEKEKSLQVVAALESGNIDKLSSALQDVQTSEVQVVPELVEAAEQRLGQLQPEREAAAKELTAAMHGKWMAGDYVVVKSSKGALVREEEDRNSKKVTTLATGTSLELLEVRGRRARISVDNVEGWLGDGKWGVIDHVDGWVSTENAAGGIIFGPATKIERIIDPVALDEAIVVAKRCGVDLKHIAEAEAQLKELRALHCEIEGRLAGVLQNIASDSDKSVQVDSIRLALAEARKYGLQQFERFSSLVSEAEAELIKLEEQISCDAAMKVDVISTIYEETTKDEAAEAEAQKKKEEDERKAKARKAALATLYRAIQKEDVAAIESAIEAAKALGVSETDLAEPIKRLQELSDLQVFLLAAKSGDSQEISRMLQRGIDPNLHGARYKDSALQYAAAAGHKSIVNALIGARADVDAQNVVGATALMHAASHGHVDVVTILLQVGASTGLRNAMDKSASDLAGPNEDIIELLTTHTAESGGENKLEGI